MKKRVKIYTVMLMICGVMALGGCGRKDDPGEEGELVFLDHREAERYNEYWLL